MSGGKGGGGGSTGGTQTVQSQSQPWQGLMPYLSGLYGSASTALKQTPNAPWGGPNVASPRPETIAGQDYSLDMANSFQNAGAGTMNLASDMISGKFLDPNQNPYFSGAVTAATRPIEEQFYNSTLPALSDQAISQGAYGGDREGITKALASGQFTKNLADTTANMAWQNYANERSLQMWAPQLMQEGEALQMAPASIYGQVGGQRQQTEQDMLTQAQQLYQGQQQAPWTGLSDYSKILGNTGGTSGNTTQTTSSTGGTPSWVQGALGGAGIGASIGNIAGATGLSGYAPFVGGGSVLGALLGLI